MSKSQLTTRVLVPLTLAIFCLVSPLAVQGQEPQDPASNTDVIQETLNKIREVEQLDKYIQENNTLKSENTSLKQQVASLTQQLAQVKQELQTLNDRLRKQLIELPTFEIKSKLVGDELSIAVLQFGEKSIRIRSDLEMSVPVSDGVWTLMKVVKITKERIELQFPDLDRVVVLYD